VVLGFLAVNTCVPPTLEKSMILPERSGRREVTHLFPPSVPPRTPFLGENRLGKHSLAATAKACDRFLFGNVQDRGALLSL